MVTGKVLDRNVVDVTREFFVEHLRSDHSRRGYAADWNDYCAWLCLQRSDAFRASAADVKNYLRTLMERGTGRAARQRALSVIRSIYGAYVVAGFLPANPAREAKNPK